VRELCGVELGQQPTPGISHKTELFEFPLTPKLLEVGNVLLPPDRHVTGYGRSAAAPLVVVDQLAPAGECIEPRK
jgi:hypothetical protein